MCLCFVLNNNNNSQNQKLLYFCVILLPLFGSTANTKLTRDGTAKPFSQDQIILRRDRGQGNIHFRCSSDNEQDWQPYPVDPHHTTLATVYMMTMHTCVQTILCGIKQRPYYIVRCNQAQTIFDERFPMKILAEMSNSARVLVENRSSEIYDRRLPVPDSVRHVFFLPSGKNASMRNGLSNVLCFLSALLPLLFYLLVSYIASSMERVCYEPLERVIGSSHKHWNHGKIMGDNSAIIPLDIRNGVILTRRA